MEFFSVHTNNNNTYFGDTLLANSPFTQPTVGATRAKETKSSFHAQEANFPLGHVFLDGQVKGQCFQVSFSQNIANMNHFFQCERQAIKPGGEMSLKMERKERG